MCDDEKDGHPCFDCAKSGEGGAFQPTPMHPIIKCSVDGHTSIVIIDLRQGLDHLYSDCPLRNNIDEECQVFMVDRDKHVDARIEKATKTLLGMSLYDVLNRLGNMMMDNESNVEEIVIECVNGFTGKNNLFTIKLEETME